jgi:F0F1-type ATP synthase epsilon subunit
MTQDTNTDKLTEQYNKRTAESSPPPEGQIYIKIYSPFKVYFDGTGVSITAENDTGLFDILPGHHKFLTLLNPCEIKVQTTNETENQVFKIERGVMFVDHDKATVFLDV